MRCPQFATGSACADRGMNQSISAATPTPPMPHRAYVAHVLPDGSDYLPRIREGLAFIDFWSCLPSRPRLFIKPNLTFPVYQPGVMTSIEAIEAAILALKDRAGSIAIGDSNSGGYNPFSMGSVYAATGISEFAVRHDVKVVNVSDLPRTDLQFRAGGATRHLPMPQLLLRDIDALITMPVPKIHMNTGVSLTFKNQWGCIPDPNDRLRLHPYFAETVTAVNRAVHARFAIIDGRYGLNRTGPMRGDVERLNWICVTNSIGAGARIACELMGVKVERIRHLRYAQRHGLLPSAADVQLNVPSLAPFVGPQFYLRRAWTDYPGLLAFHHPALAHIAYFSRWSAALHRLLYLVRKPFYDYGNGSEPTQ